MKIYIAKHYWKEGENATWEVHEKVDRELFSYLKKSYQTFVQNKPKMINKDRWFIYLCYDETKDAFDRSITNITFFISKKKLELNLCPCKYEDLEYEVSDKRMWIMLVGGVVLMGSFYFGIPSSNKESLANVIPTSNGKSSSEKESIKTKKNLEENNKIKEEKLKKEPKTHFLVAQKKDFNSKVNNILIESIKEIKIEEDYNKISNTWKKVKPIIKDKQAWLNKKNNDSINNIHSLYSGYTTLLRDGISVTIILFNQKNKSIGINYKKSLIEKKKIERQSIILVEGKYKIHLVKQTSSRQFINGNFTINKDDLIKLKNGKKIKKNKEIDNNYYLIIKKLEGVKHYETKN